MQSYSEYDVREMFSRNQPTLTEDEQAALAEKTAVVVGCGGLGGYVLEYLVRLGVGTIRVIDGDVFAPSNLNRQILSTTKTLGASKVACADARAHDINPRVCIDARQEMLTTDNAPEVLAGADVVVDALDNAAARMMLEQACSKVGCVLVHAAVRAQLVQAAVVYPGEGTLTRLYSSAPAEDVLAPEAFRQVKSCLSFVPPCAASIEVAEALKVLLGKTRGIGEGEVVLFDLARLSLEKFHI